jgi:chromosome partitioning protein
MRDDLAKGGIPVFKAMIRRTVGFAKAAMSGRPIRDIEDSRARAAWGDYKSLGDEIREMLK